MSRGFSLYEMVLGIVILMLVIALVVGIVSLAFKAFFWAFGG